MKTGSKKLHAKIGQLTVEKDFLADASKRLGLFGIYPLLIWAKTIERDKRMTLQIKKKPHIAEFKFKVALEAARGEKTV